MSKDVIKRTIAVSITLIIIICMIISESVGAEINKNTNLIDLTKKTYSDDWYTTNASDIVGKIVSITSVKNGENAIKMKGAYCVDPETSRDNGELNRTGYCQIVNMFDINNEEANKVVVYTLVATSDNDSDATYMDAIDDNGNVDANHKIKRKVYDIAEPDVEPLLEIAYLQIKSDENGGHPNQDGGYKDTLSRIFKNQLWKAKLDKIGLSGFFHTSFTQGNLSSQERQKILTEAAQYAHEIQSQGINQKGILSQDMTPEEEAKVTLKVENGKTYIGPYKVSKSAGCEVEEITIKGININGNITATGILNDKGEEASLADIQDQKEFYVVVDSQINIDEISSIEIKAKESVSVLKSRMVLIGNSDSQNFVIWKSEDAKQPPKDELSIPKLQYGKLMIIKRDELGNIDDLSGIGFKVYSNKEGKWLKVENGEIKFDAFDKVEPFETDKEGKVPTIENMPVGTYKVYETKIPDALKDFYTLTEITLPDGTKAEAKEMKDQNGKSDIEIVSGATVEMGATNSRDFGGYRVIKTDSETELPLEGIEFKLYKVDSGWVAFDKNDENRVTSVTEKTVKNATSLTTDANGITETIIRLPLGDYEVYETSVGNYKQYKLGVSKVNGEEFTGDKKDTVTVVANEVSQTTAYPVKESKITNEPVPEIAISGIVWEEVGEGKTWDYFDSKLTDSDYKLDGIQVKLVNRATGEVRTTTTAEINGVHGSYRFEEVAIKDLDNLYVEFTYDGITYQSVNKGSMSDSVASKADENSAQRKNLNSAFSEVTGEGQKVEYEGNTITLSYSKEEPNDTSAEPTVTLNNICDRDSTDNATNRNSGFVKITKQGDFLVNSNIADSYLKEAYNALVKNPKEPVTEISNVNLGVYKRIQPDLKLDTEITKATVTIDGTTYDYNNKSKGNPELNTWPNGTSFERKDPGENDSKYKAPIYNADLKYENDTNPERELKVYATYKIALTNNSGTGLSARVNSIMEKYSKEFAFNRAYMLDSNGKEVAMETRSYMGNEELSYKYIEITGIASKVGTINPEETKYIYVVLEIPRDEIYHEGQVDENKIYRNYAEISSYTVIKDNMTYAAVDKDSIPNNGTFPARSEDDEDWATGLQLVNAKRLGKGIVFEDGIVTTTGAGQERLGNGSYEATEKGIGNVQVLLVSKNDNTVVQATTTNADGTYTLEDFMSGAYYIRFAWGEGMGSQTSDGKPITVDDYKSTIWKDSSQNSSERWYNQDSPRLSDALDDWETRTLLDKENASLQELLNKPATSTGNAIMTSVTNDLNVPFEIQEVVLELEDGTTTTEERKIEVRDFIKNVDFGIVERPKQSIDIEKNVETVKIITDQGQPIAEASVKDGKLEVLSGENYVTGGPQLGYIKCEVDTDIINSGTHAEVGYKITVKNTSEIDYDGEGYYKYGNNSNQKGNLVTLSTDGVYDYLSGISADVDKIKDEWEILNKDSTDVHTQTVTTTLAERYNSTGSYSSWYEQESNGGRKYVEEVTGSQMQETISEYNEEELLTIQNMKSVFEAGNEIAKLANEVTLKPGENKDINYYASTILTTTGDIRFDNTVEVANVIRNGNVGRNVNIENSNFYNKAEWITVTPPTGEDRDYTPIIIAGVSAIALLGAGIVFIKKIVLK